MKTAFVKIYFDKLRSTVLGSLKKRDYTIIKEWSGKNHFIYYERSERIDWKTVHTECKIINYHPINYILSDKNELAYLTKKEGLKFIPYSFMGINMNHTKEMYRNFNGSSELGKDLWIVKPPKSYGGKEIKILTTDELLNPYHDDGFYGYTIQKYIEKPLLLNGNKFDFRMYVLFNQENELYIYPSYTVRYSVIKYTSKDIKDLSGHLTNISIQKHLIDEKEYDKLVSSEIEFWEMYEREYGERFDLIGKVSEMMVKIFDLLQGPIKRYERDRYYQLFGIDVMMDESLNPYLIEINNGPGIGDFGNKNLFDQRERIIDNVFKLTIDRVFDKKREDTEFIFLKKYI